MDRVAVGEQHALAERLARAPQRVGVVPLERLRVVDELEREPVGALEGRDALGEPLVRVAGDDHRTLEPDRGEVAERDVEDRAIAVDRQQRLGQLRRLVPEALAGARGQHHPDHGSSSSCVERVRFGPAAPGGDPARARLDHEEDAEHARGHVEAGRQRAGGEQREPDRHAALPARQAEPRGGHRALVAQPVGEVVVVEGKRGDQCERRGQGVGALECGEPDEGHVLDQPHQRRLCPCAAARRPAARRAAQEHRPREHGARDGERHVAAAQGGDREQRDQAGERQRRPGERQPRAQHARQRRAPAARPRGTRAGGRERRRRSSQRSQDPAALRVGDGEAAPREQGDERDPRGRTGRR